MEWLDELQLSEVKAVITFRVKLVPPHQFSIFNHTIWRRGIQIHDTHGRAVSDDELIKVDVEIEI